MAKAILIVDDDPHLTRAIATVLARQGFAVQTAANGREALASIERAQPALILLDLQMPVLDGRGFVRALRESAITLPIIVMSADPDVCWAAKELDAVASLAKPFDVVELVSTVEAAVPA